MKVLLQFEWRSLSELAEILDEKHGLEITLPGLLKHMKRLQKAGIVRSESGIFARKPDARKTIYTLEGKERIQKLLQQLQEIGNLLEAGSVFSKTARKARWIQGVTSNIPKEEMENFQRLLIECESGKTNLWLTEDEKKKVKLWRMMIKIFKE